MQTRFSPAQLADPDTAESAKILRSCVHCGFCTATCPTYALLGDELDSPRGRIYLIKEMLENDRPATETVVKHIDRCLSCLSCMTTCPSGVNYMHLVDHARQHIEKTYVRPWPDRALRRLLGFVLPRPGLFRVALQASRLGQPFARWMPPPLRAMLALAPARVPRSSAMDRPRVFASAGKRVRRVALLTGCAQRVLAPQINEATIRLLTRHGCEVVVAKGAGCCGALTHHLGQGGHEAAAANIRAWSREIETGGLDAIVINASGCGTTVKDYGFLFRDDPVLAEPARAVSALARDVTELMSEIGLLTPTISTGQRVAYHSACSLQHGQQVRAEPVAAAAQSRFRGGGHPGRSSLLRLRRDLQPPAAGDCNTVARPQGGQHRACRPGDHRRRQYRLHDADRIRNQAAARAYGRAAGLVDRRSQARRHAGLRVQRTDNIKKDRGNMFKQILTPVWAGSLPLSFVVAALPIVVVLVMLGVLRRPAWQASLGGLVVGLVIAVLIWQFPLRLALDSIAAGAVFALWPVMWIVVNALLLYNIAVESGRFDAFRNWVIEHLPNDRRVVLVVIGFCFGCLLEGIAGFGTPVAITSALLILVGFPALEAVDLHADLQHRTGRLRRARRSGDRARAGHRPAGRDARRDDRAAVAVLRTAAAVLCHDDLWRLPVRARLVAGVAGRGRQFRRGAIRLRQLYQLCADRRSRLVDVAARDTGLPAAVVAAGGCGVCDRRTRRAGRRERHPSARGRHDPGAAADGAGRRLRNGRPRLARLAALDRGLRRGDPLDLPEDRGDRTTGDPLARAARPGLDHAVQGQAVCRHLGLPATCDRDRHPCRGDHHGRHGRAPTRAGSDTRWSPPGARRASRC